jgi:hypothetical protein
MHLQKVFTENLFSESNYRYRYLNLLLGYYLFRLFYFDLMIVFPISINQCCGSELIFFGFGSTNYFFRIRIRIRILRLIFSPQIFLNGASNCFHMCSGTCTSEKKKLAIEKHKIFLFQVFDFWFFTKMFILQQCLNPNPYPNPNFLFGFGSSQNIWLFRIRIHNTAINL